MVQQMIEHIPVYGLNAAMLFEEGDKLVVLLSSLFPIRKTFLQTLDLRILRCYLRIVSGPKLRVFVLVQNAALKIVIEPEFCLCKPLFLLFRTGQGQQIFILGASARRLFSCGVNHFLHVDQLLNLSLHRLQNGLLQQSLFD